ncbi:cytochrome P450, partial [Streptomyces zhihengii]
MSESVHAVGALPAERSTACPFDPPAELLDARRHGPISRYTHPGGKPGWLITGYEMVRSVLADPRFSSRKELMNVVDFALPPAPPGEFLLMDEPEHSRY